MKSDKQYNDDELYQQFMDELQEGADEYDRILQEHKVVPMQKKIWPWLVAACVAGLVIVCLKPPISQTEQVAMVEQKEPAARANIRKTVGEESSKNIAVVCSQKKEAEPLRLKMSDEVKKSDVNNDDNSNDDVNRMVMEANEKCARASAIVSRLLAAEPEVLTESDIAITNPENLKLTSEELEMLDRQKSLDYVGRIKEAICAARCAIEY